MKEELGISIKRFFGEFHTDFLPAHPEKIALFVKMAGLAKQPSVVKTKQLPLQLEHILG